MSDIRHLIGETIFNIEDDDPDCEEVADTILAALDAAGYAVVKKEPTEAMLEAAAKSKMPDGEPVSDWIVAGSREDYEAVGISWPEHPYDRWHTLHCELNELLFSTAYCAMLAASQLKGEGTGFNEPTPHVPQYPRALCELPECACTGAYLCDSARETMAAKLRTQLKGETR
jgi:hypothetical protein